MRRWHITLAVALVALISGGDQALAAPTAPDPAARVLQLSDLPDGFARSSARRRSNATTAQENDVSVALLRRWGRITGYEAVYDRAVDPSAPPRGPLTVTTNVSTYRSASGLREAFARSARSIETSGAPQPVFRRRQLATRVGDETRLYTARFTQDGIPVVVFTIVWRTKGALGYLNVAGVQGKLTPAEVIALARRQQARISGAVKPDPGNGDPVL